MKRALSIESCTVYKKCTGYPACRRGFPCTQPDLVQPTPVALLRHGDGLMAIARATATARATARSFGCDVRTGSQTKARLVRALHQCIPPLGCPPPSHVRRPDSVPPSQVELKRAEEALARRHGRGRIALGGAVAGLELDDAGGALVLRDEDLREVDAEALHLAHNAQLLLVPRLLELDLPRLDLGARLGRLPLLRHLRLVLLALALPLGVVLEGALGELGLPRGERDLRLQPRLLRRQLRLLGRAALLCREAEVLGALLLRERLLLEAEARALLDGRVVHGLEL